MDLISVVLIGCSLAVIVSAVVWEILNSERFGRTNGPMTVPVRNALFWLTFLCVVALTAWGLKHGNTLLYGP